MKPITLLLTLLAFLLFTGCSAMHTAIEKRDLYVETQMTRTIFLDPVPPEQQTVYLRIRNTSDKEIDVEPRVRRAIESRGFKVVPNVDDAHFVMMANVLQVGKSDMDYRDSAYQAGFEGIVIGMGVGEAAKGRQDSREAATAGVVGGMVGVIADAMVEDTLYTITTDVQVRQRTGEGEQVARSEQTNTDVGEGTTLRQDVTGAKTDWKIYETRIISTANQANLEYKDAEEALVNGLVRSLSGMF